MLTNYGREPTDPPAPPKRMVTGKWAVKQTVMDAAGTLLTQRLTDHGLRALSTQFKPKNRGGTATWQLWGVRHTLKRVQLDYIMGCKMMQGATVCSTVWGPSIHMYGYHQDLQYFLILDKMSGSFASAPTFCV